MNQRRPSGPGEKLVEMAESSSDKYAYENKIAERFGGQKELELVVPTPSGIPKGLLLNHIHLNGGWKRAPSPKAALLRWL